MEICSEQNDTTVINGHQTHHLSSILKEADTSPAAGLLSLPTLPGVTTILPVCPPRT